MATLFEKSMSLTLKQILRDIDAGEFDRVKKNADAMKDAIYRQCEENPIPVIKINGIYKNHGH